MNCILWLLVVSAGNGIAFYLLYCCNRRLTKYAGFQPFFPPELSFTAAKNLKYEATLAAIIFRIRSNKGSLADV